MVKKSISRNYLEWKNPLTSPARLEVLARRIAGARADNLQDLVAQIRWLNEDLGYELKEGLRSPYDNILDNIQGGAEIICSANASDFQPAS